jgi:plastocyanin
MFTSKDGEHPHNHRVEINEQGNGKTIDTSYGPAHTHKIEDYKIKESNDHVHDDLEPPQKVVWTNGDDDPHNVTVKEDRQSMKDKIEKQKLKVSVELEVPDG